MWMLLPLLTLMVLVVLKTLLFWEFRTNEGDNTSTDGHSVAGGLRLGGVSHLNLLSVDRA